MVIQVGSLSGYWTELKTLRQWVLPLTYTPSGRVTGRSAFGITVLSVLSVETGEAVVPFPTLVCLIGSHVWFSCYGFNKPNVWIWSQFTLISSFIGLHPFTFQNAVYQSVPCGWCWPDAVLFMPTKAQSHLFWLKMESEAIYKTESLRVRHGLKTTVLHNMG